MNKITCTACGEAIDVNAALYKQLSEQVKSDIGQKISVEKKELENKIRKQLMEEKNQELASYREELNLKIEQVKELNKTKAELERIKREKEELRSAIEAESEQKLTERLSAERKRLMTEVEQKNQLKLSEREHIIGQLKDQLRQAQQKAEQGSMQIQGEVFELAIETWLKNMFPLDSVDEIKKGVRGADCLLTVNTRSYKNCGKILIECKRTKTFEPQWIEKLKVDMVAANAKFGIIVTETFPKDKDHLFQVGNVWVCSTTEFKALMQVMREAVILTHSFSISQENKGTKMQMLYDFLISNEFKQQINCIVEGFTQMNEDLASEKRAFEGIWKKRQKQIDKVILNTTHMFSSVKGIAGSSIESIELLELQTEK